MNCLGCGKPIVKPRRVDREWCDLCWPKWLAYLHDSNAGAPSNFADREPIPGDGDDADSATVGIRITEGLQMIAEAQAGETVEVGDVVEEDEPDEES